MGTSNWSKFSLLMWKNWLLQWRHKTQLVVEILIPLFFSALLVLFRSLVTPEDYHNPTTFKPIAIDNLEEIRKFQSTTRFIRNITNNPLSPQPITWELAYSPNNEYLDKIVRTAAESLNITAHGLPNSSKLEYYVQNASSFAAIVFPNEWANLKSYPTNFKYAIRFPGELRSGRKIIMMTWRTNLMFPTFETGGPRNIADDDGGTPPGYIVEGFIAVQNAIATAFVKVVDEGRSAMPNILMQRFPYPPFTLDHLLEGMKAFVSLIILLSFVYPCSCTVKFITAEKEKQLKESMKIMGLSNWLHWTAWFVKTMIFMIISITIITILIKVEAVPDSHVAVLTHSHWSTIWTFLFIYCISATTFCFMIAVFFSKATTAATVAGLIWFIFYCPYSFTQESYDNMGLGQKLAVSLFSNSAMAYGFQLMVRLEGTSEGLQWDNMWRPVSIDDNLPVGYLILMMLLDALIYLLIALYVEQIFPGEFGVPEKWYFPFTRKFWTGEPDYHGIEDESNCEGKKQNFEPDPTGLTAGIQIRNLRKIYGNNKVAVDGLSMNMYEDQITVLLGHNGAGKTTTMSMLTGMFPPSAGSALVNGCDIRTNIQGVRTSLGLCPQHNVLFDELTIAEHITFYSRLKGLSGKSVTAEINKYVRVLDLEPKRNVKASYLSGGMKRKLSVGVALCGGSKVVLCDEPTSGMDPAARRSLWDLLQAEKKGRTILLSTHFMDEADVLGDRIAIMAEGDLKCVGSSFFLKKKFGVGYHLVCVKGDNCESGKLTSLLKKYIPDLKVESEVGSELSYQLPDGYSSVFEEMLGDLEDSSQDLRLDGYGISLTTLEEVFMRVGTDRIESAADESLTDSDNDSVVQYTSTDQSPLLKGPNLFKNQWIAMLLKKYLYTIRNWILLLVQNVMPIFFIAITVIVVRSQPDPTKLDSLRISLDTYDSSVTVLENSSNFQADSMGAKIVNEYQNLFKTVKEGTELKILTPPEDFSTFIINTAKKALVRVNSKYLVGATIKNDNTIVWFNNQPYHTAPLALNLFHNAAIKAIMGPKYNIEVTNSPLPFTLEYQMNLLQLQKLGISMGYQLAINLSFALSFVTGFYILFLIKERECRAKLLQFVSGASVIIFWLANFVWDLLTYLVTTIILVVTLAIFQQDGWATPEELGRTFLVIALFGFSAIPLTYLASMIFSDAPTGFSRISIFNIFTGVAFFVVVSVMSFEAFDLQDVADTLGWIFRIFPHFALAQSFNYLDTTTTTRNVCELYCKYLEFCNDQLLCAFKKECCVKSYFAWEKPGIGPNLVYMVATGVIFMLILFLKEFRVLDEIIYLIQQTLFKKPLPRVEYANIDEDVYNEKERVKNLSMQQVESHNLVINQMSKFYKNFLAVNQISVGVKHSECFGLLGINGAGKTSTFKMLTGDEKLSSGIAFVKGINLKKDMQSIYREIGYCPQFDALLEDLTGRETIKIFSLLRGIPNRSIESLTTNLAKDLGFVKHLDKKIREYSGGNKRKLSTAVSLIGYPAVVYLDEPTTGMDPRARRQLWNMLCRIRDSGKSIVLTSHSMEECEALCTRLAIMVNGEFKCLGSTQHLKNKFLKGLVLIIKLKREKPKQENGHVSSSLQSSEHVQMEHEKVDVDAVKRFVSSNFPGAVLKEEYQELLTYFISTTSVKWSKIFGLMEKNKDLLHIEDYSLSQTTLEQIFLEFVKYQRDGKLEEQKMNKKSFFKKMVSGCCRKKPSPDN